MMVLASRPGNEIQRGDREDIVTLCRHLGLTDAERVMDIVLRYYPTARVSPRAVFMVREILGSSSFTSL